MAHASGKMILVVEDEPDVRNFLAACLEDAGFRVETAVDGIDALEKIDAVNPDLMTLDMVMPRKSGIRVIRTLRKMEKWAKLPIIVITAHAHDELGSEDVKSLYAFTSGLRPRVTMEKPISPPKLAKAISEILEVEIEEIDTKAQLPTDERQKIVDLLQNTDSDTLQRIREVLEEK